MTAAEKILAEAREVLDRTRKFAPAEPPVEFEDAVAKWKREGEEFQRRREAAHEELRRKTAKAASDMNSDVALHRLQSLMAQYVADQIAIEHTRMMSIMAGTIAEIQERFSKKLADLRAELNGTEAKVIELPPFLQRRSS
jgi:hypothetical protein